MNYGAKIAALRKEHSLTQSEFGEKLNVTFQAVSKWERNESMPDFETMSRIAKLFGVPLTYFEEENGDSETAAAVELPRAESAKTRPEVVVVPVPVPSAASSAPRTSSMSPRLLGTCLNCGKVVYEGERAPTKKMICRTCFDEHWAKKAQNERAEKKNAEKTKQEIEKGYFRRIVWACLVAFGLFCLSLTVDLIVENYFPAAYGPSWALFFAFLCATLLFLWSFQLFFNGVIRQIMLFPMQMFNTSSCAIAALVIIFLLPVWLICMAFAYLISTIASPFTFVPTVIGIHKRDPDLL